VKRVATHKQPDADAVASAWLTEIYLFAGEEVEVIFVPRHRARQAAPNADCFVDIANMHDPERLCFDHKPPAFADRNATCATKLVWEHLLRLGRPVGHLEALVETVHEGDHNPPRRPSPALQASRTGGFHAHVAQAHRAGADDGQLYSALRRWLNEYDAAVRGSTPVGSGAMKIAINYSPQAEALRRRETWPRSKSSSSPG